MQILPCPISGGSRGFVVDDILDDGLPALVCVDGQRRGLFAFGAGSTT